MPLRKKFPGTGRHRGAILVDNALAYREIADLKEQLVQEKVRGKWLRAFARVSDGGVLAIQMPANMSEEAHQLMRDLASSPKWCGRFPHGGVREWFVHDAAFYYDALAKCTSRIDLWETTYYHVMPDAKAIALWYKGTGLRPFLDSLPDDTMREQFVNDYAKSLVHRPEST